MDSLSNDEASIDELMESINSSSHCHTTATIEKFSPRESRSSSDDFHHVGSFDMSESSLKMSSVLAEVDEFLYSTPRSSVDGGFVVVNGNEHQTNEDIDCTKIMNELHNEKELKEDIFEQNLTPSEAVTDAKESSLNSSVDLNSLDQNLLDVPADAGIGTSRTSQHNTSPDSNSSEELNQSVIPSPMGEEDPFPVYTKWLETSQANLMKKRENEVRLGAEAVDVGQKQLKEFHLNRRRLQELRGDRNRKEETEKYTQTTVSSNSWQKVLSLIDSPERNRHENKENDSRRSMFSILLRLKNS